MHPLFKTPRGLAIYLLVWLVAGALVAFVWTMRQPAQLVWALGFTLPLAVLTGMFALSLYVIDRAFPLRPARWMSALWRRFVAAMLLALAAAGGAWLWNAAGSLFGRSTLVAFGLPDWLALVGVTWGIFMLSALIHDALLAQQAARSAAETEAQARLLAREMEIKALRHQIDPHFLFNCLNSISALTLADPAAARAMIIDLAQYFRQTLALGSRDRIPLKDELELVARYVAVEQRRLGDRLRLHLDVDPNCLVALVPPLVLQPLVENAVKHGIRSLESGGAIDLVAHRIGGHLDLWVSNPVDPSTRGDASGLTHGLRHLQTRLKAQCPGTDRVEIEDLADRFRVHLTLPWHL